MKEMVIKNKQFSQFILKLLQSNKSSPFLSDINNSVIKIKRGQVLLIAEDFKEMRSTIRMCYSENQQEAIKSNKHLLNYKKSVEECFPFYDYTIESFINDLNTAEKLWGLYER